MMIPTVLDAYPTPPCARLLGLDILEADKAAGWVKIRFNAREAFANASGHIQGGFLTAMLDDTIGPAVLIATDAARLPVTIALNVTFLASARPGPLIGQASVRKLGKTIGYVEASLEDEQGVEIARATSSVRLVPMSAPAAEAPGAAPT
jgi:uncharacterized protein (TIGR00369 family)